MPPYSWDYLVAKPTIRITHHGDLKEETNKMRVYLKSEVVIEEKIAGAWQVTEIYVPA